jgi:hypothetical protein
MHICLDFDGVLHRYSRGWQGGVIYDDPVEDSVAACLALAEWGFKLTVCTARDDVDAVRVWLAEMGFPEMTVTNKKPPADLYLDDRALKFEGWTEALTLIRMMGTVKP